MKGSGCSERAGRLRLSEVAPWRLCYKRRLTFPRTFFPTESHANVLPLFRQTDPVVRKLVRYRAARESHAPRVFGLRSVSVEFRTRDVHSPSATVRNCNFRWRSIRKLLALRSDLQPAEFSSRRNPPACLRRSATRPSLLHENRGVPLVTGKYPGSLARLQRIVSCRASRTLEGCGAPQEYKKSISQYSAHRKASRIFVAALALRCPDQPAPRRIAPILWC